MDDGELTLEFHHRGGAPTLAAIEILDPEPVVTDPIL